MEIFYEIKPLRAFLSGKRKNLSSIGLVPTMGALHQGHLELVKASRGQNDLTVCSIYVNPTQFNNALDLEKYPRTLDSDKEKLEKAGCDVIFAPSNEEMYQGTSQIRFDVGEIGSFWEGEFRPGHFNGVAQVVCKLFNIVQPHRAYFGQKDFQQYKVIEKLVDELQFDIQLTSVPIFRELNGLAMSSRNQRLNETEKENATVFYQSLLVASELLKKGEQIIAVKDKVRQMCEAKPNVKLEYIEWVDTKNLKPVQNVLAGSVLLIAGYVGEVRLIDNLLLE
ncbi:MAG: pantoate--beta-alanine ligase [Cytophagales bacterium]|jgi:pantoate--beta-alanine ligase|nr:pantoate--beta-alanine ligase [Cytophagales bacterium]MCA6369566.1 pantoate--beta-alanine ligase [Cytophagales bacterium]MCA6370720.1 pantoate--beta-alanine ligase [Cytophagales bacterium]MCA6377098.1 pantoate--beta-alanine ligase [Cytophagales bacterium]MCA6383751.1 pantoate--beta-alanine ligase [Cytophagales bacterium]